MQVRIDIRMRELIEAIVKHSPDQNDYSEIESSLRDRIDTLAMMSLLGDVDEIKCLARIIRVSHPALARRFVQTLQNAMPLAKTNELARRACRVLNNLLYPMGIRHYMGQTHDKQHVTTKGQYPYIAAGEDVIPRLFIEHPEYAEGSAFIDIGCGIGEKTFHAALLSEKMHCEGLEYDSATVAVAKSCRSQVFTDHRIHFHCTDALEFNFKYFDRIYTYVPLEDRKKLKEFYTYIWDSIPNGAMWYEVDGNQLWPNLGKKIRNATHLGSHHLMQTPKKRKQKRKKKLNQK